MTADEVTLPDQVKAQILDAGERFRAIRRDLEFHRKPGPVPAKRGRGPFVFFSSNDKGEVDKELRTWLTAADQATHGKKRMGRRKLYLDLVEAFMLLKRQGVTLPRNKSLSKNAFQFGLGDVLRRHGYTKDNDKLLISNGAARKKVAVRMDRIFRRIADAIEQKTPPQTVVIVVP